MADRRAYLQPQQGAAGFAATMKRFGATVSLATTDLALNKSVALFVVPAGFVVTSISVTVTDLDTNGTPTIVFDIGDNATSGRLVSGATTAQAGGTTTTLAAAGLRYAYTTDTEINWKTTTAAATAAAGTVTVDLFGYIQ